MTNPSTADAVMPESRTDPEHCSEPEIPSGIEGVVVVNATPEVQEWVDGFAGSGLAVPADHDATRDDHTHTSRTRVITLDLLWSAIEASVTEGMVLGDDSNTTPWSIAKHGLPPIQATLPHSGSMWHNFWHAIT